MSSQLAKRLAALERRAAVGTPSRYEVHILGGIAKGLEGRACDRATAGAWVWDRGPGEEWEAFRARVWAEVAEDGGYCVVFGGLPDEFDA